MKIIKLLCLFLSLAVIFSVSNMIIRGVMESSNRRIEIVDDLSSENLHAAVLNYFDSFFLSPHYDYTMANIYSIEFYEVLYCPERPQFAALQAMGFPKVDDEQLLFFFYTSEQWRPLIQNRHILQGAGWLSVPHPAREDFRTSDISVRYRVFWNLTSVSHVDEDLRIYRFYTQLAPHPNNILPFLVSPLFSSGLIVGVKAVAENYGKKRRFMREMRKELSERQKIDIL